MSRNRQNEISAANQDHLSPLATPPTTSEEFRRKGDFLIKQFSSPQGPLLTPNGESTVLALSAIAWGEHAPKTSAAAHKLAKKGKALLKKADHESKKNLEAARSKHGKLDPTDSIA